MSLRLWSKVTGLMAFGLLVSACAMNPARSLPPLDAQPMTSYQMSPGDEIRVVVYGQDDVPQDYRIDERGYISMPLAGSIRAAGMTTGDLEKEVDTKLKKVLVDPNVTVQVMSARPFYVVGGVLKPGSYPYTKDMTVLSAIATGGGFTPYAFKDYFGVTRQMDGKPQEFRADRNTPLRPDDLVYVYEMY